MKKIYFVIALIAATFCLSPMTAFAQDPEPKDNGVFLCSGVIDMYRKDIEDTFAATPLQVVEHHQAAGWNAYAAVMKKEK